MLPGTPVDPGFGRPGGPVDPGYGRPGWSPVDPGLAAGGRDHIRLPIVYPPGLPDQGLPPTEGLPPLAPSHPIAGVPDEPPAQTKPPIGMWPPVAPPRERLPAGSVLLIPLPTDKPMPMPPEVPAGSKPVLAYYGPGTLPVVVWVPPQASPK